MEKSMNKKKIGWWEETHRNPKRGNFSQQLVKADVESSTISSEQPSCCLLTGKCEYSNHEIWRKGKSQCRLFYGCWPHKPVASKWGKREKWDRTRLLNLHKKGRGHDTKEQSTKASIKIDDKAKKSVVMALFPNNS